MSQPSDLARRRIGAVLQERSGAYLFNPVKEPFTTCEVCRTPVDGYLKCYQCHSHASVSGIADRVGLMIYGIRGEQSGYLMHSYKGRLASEESRETVALLLALGLLGHVECAGRLAGTPVTHWATVPSLQGRPGVHPLRKITQKLTQTMAGRMAEIRLEATATVGETRVIDPDYFRISGGEIHGAHVLLIDDTWTTGAHVHSAAIALRDGGASQVSALVLARWLNPCRSAAGAQVRTFIDSLHGRTFNPEVCPWTGSECP